jgi:XTP/dITP diphosphohydrolase
VGSARRAYFEANLCLVDAAGIHHYAGRVEGSLAEAPRGTGGFGFDPLFVPDDPAARGRTFAEMTGEEKGAISHRGRAVAQLVEALRKAANR